MLTTEERARVEQFARASGCPLVGRAIYRLGVYLELLLLWNRRFRLTGARSRAELLELHLVDSLAVAAVVPPGGRLADLGSGAGLPGIPVAVAREDTGVALVESRRRRASFLREAVRALELGNASVVEERGEDLARRVGAGAFSIVVARAVPFATLLRVGGGLLSAAGCLVAMRGAAGLAAGEGELAATEGFAVASELRYELCQGRVRHRLVVLARRGVSRET